MLQHVHKIRFLLNDHSTTILTAAGVGGTIATAVLTGRATFKAAEIIVDEERLHQIRLEEGTVHTVHLSKTEKTKFVWRLYLPPVAAGVLTVTSIIYANKISSKKIAALAVAGGISERALTEYKEKVVEKLGARQDQKIRDEIAEDTVKRNPPLGAETFIIGSGDVLCYDMLTGRYFQSNVEAIRRAENNVNYQIIHFDSCSLSHFYDDIGLPPTMYSDQVGFNMGTKLDLDFSTVLTDDGRPCLTINFKRLPSAEYSDVWT